MSRVKVLAVFTVASLISLLLQTLQIGAIGYPVVWLTLTSLIAATVAVGLFWVVWLYHPKQGTIGLIGTFLVIAGAGVLFVQFPLAVIAGPTQAAQAAANYRIVTAAGYVLFAGGIVNGLYTLSTFPTLQWAGLAFMAFSTSAWGEYFVAQQSAIAGAFLFTGFSLYGVSILFANRRPGNKKTPQRLRTR